MSDLNLRGSSEFGRTLEATEGGGPSFSTTCRCGLCNVFVTRENRTRRTFVNMRMKSIDSESVSGIN